MSDFVAYYVESVWDDITGIYILNNQPSSVDAFVNWLAEKHPKETDVYTIAVHSPKFVRKSTVSFHNLEEVGL